MENEKLREAKLRRELKKMGYFMRKSRVQNITVDNMGGYMILDIRGNYVIAGSRFELTIEDVESFVNEK